MFLDMQKAGRLQRPVLKAHVPRAPPQSSPSLEINPLSLRRKSPLPDQG